MTDAVTWTLGLSAVFAGAAAAGGLLDLLGWLSDRRHIQWWDRHRNDISDVPVAPAGAAGHVRLRSPSFPTRSFPDVPRT